MRITAFHVDGFGALASFAEEELAPGLVVIHGPNEAGKSTLFDFLTGVLFGFPQRRDNPRFHAPVRGGRHGGRVCFSDDSGGDWVVERHAGAQRGLRVQLPNGSAGDERDLARVLAGASSGLFRAVFAISLDDLRQLDTLTTDEVRELLFASSIFGQRRSATKAIKQLTEAREDLARPRRGDARANRLARELVETRGELVVARREMSTFAELSRRAAETETRMAGLRERSRAERCREHELELLMMCWKSHCSAESARAELNDLSMLAPSSSHELSAGDLARLEPELHELSAQLSGHRERLDKLAELRHQHDGLAASMHRRLDALGQGWTAERVAQIPSAEPWAEHARAARRQLAELAGTQATAAALLEEAHVVLEEATGETEAVTPATALELGLPPAKLDEILAGPDGLGPHRRELDARRRAVHELRQWMAELDEAKGAMPGDGQRNAGAGRLDPHREWAYGLLMMLAAIVSGAFAVTLLAGHRPTIGAFAAGLGVLLAVGAVVAHRRSRPGARERDRSPGPVSNASEEASSEAAGTASRARGEISRLAAGFGLRAPPSKVDVERLDIALQTRSELAARLDDLWTARRRAEAKVAAARRALAGENQRLYDAERAFSLWRRGCGLETAETPDAVLEAIASITELKEGLAGLRRIERAISGLSRSVAEFSGRLRRLRVVGEADGDGDRDAGESWPEERLEALLTDLVHAAAEAGTVEHRRTDLGEQIRRAELEVDEALGAGSGAERLRQELAGGQVLSWRRELDELEEAREAVRQADEEAVREHQSLLEVMTRLASSHGIVALEQRQAAIEADLDQVLDRYLALGTARALLRRTLSLHERERQPAVIARAASHFERTTAGRYVGLVPSASADGRQTIGAIGPSGASVDAADLSRGSIEQLYLCLRLGLADSFAERAVSLPIFLDDVLVNFDPARARAVATELAASASCHQIIFFTCHPHLAELALKASSEGPVPSQLVEMSRL